MLVRSTYLGWAAQHYGKVRFDLATSGMPAPPAEDLGSLSTEALLDATSWTDLRVAIARYNDVPVAETAAALGTTHALWLACAAILTPGDDVLIEAPGYEHLARVAELAGANVVHFERSAAASFALEADAVARAMTPRTRLVIVTNPHNPSGHRSGPQTIRAVADVAELRGARLVVDEVYAPFDAFVDHRGVFVGSARGLGPNVVCASSLGKSYGLGAARIGWLLAPADVIERVHDAVLNSTGALPLAHAGVGVRAFERIGALAERARERLGDKRTRVEGWAHDLGLSWSAPASGLFGLARLPGYGNLTEFVEKTAREREVLVAPGAFFGVPDGFRLAWSAPRERLDEGLERLGAAIKTLSRPPKHG